ncbi:MAG: hypothetical protein HQM10_04880 [Candidatus Riflebacteria bacterium]|nr:hypothetical protein [Candidatus Riflebacteria bacterium]
MISKNYFYQFFGLSFESEIELPELTPVLKRECEADVKILFGITDDELVSPLIKAQELQITPGNVLICFEKLVRFQIIDGNKILIQRYVEVTDWQIRFLLLGSPFGILFLQRGKLPLHSSSLAVEGASILFAGRSGTGKSSTVNAFQKRGYEIFTDELTLIELGTDKTPIAFSGYPTMKLWEETLFYHGMNPAGFHRQHPDKNKYIVPIPHGLSGKAFPVKKIYILEFSEESPFQIVQVKAVEKFRIIRKHTFRKGFIRPLGVQHLFYEIASRLAETIPITRILRTKNIEQMNHQIDLIEEDLKKQV